jgi:hypothetical protein
MPGWRAILRWGPWQGDPRGTTPRHAGPHAAMRHRRAPPPPAPGRGAAGGASRPWEGVRGAPVGAAGELAAPAGGVEGRRSRRARREARGPGCTPGGAWWKALWTEAPPVGKPLEGAPYTGGRYGDFTDSPVRRTAWAGGPGGHLPGAWGAGALEGGGRWRGPCHVIGGMIWDRRRGGWWASRGATCGGVRAGEVTGGAAVGLGGHTGQLAQGRIAAPKCNIYIINTVVVRATRNMDHRSVDIYIYPCTCPVPRDPRGGGPPGGSPPKARPKGLSRDFTTFQTTKYPKCHSAFRKSGPLCMVFLSCTVHPHTKIVPRSNF